MISFIVILVALAVTHYKVGQADRASVYLAGVNMGLLIGAILVVLTK